MRPRVPARAAAAAVLVAAGSPAPAVSQETSVLPLSTAEAAFGGLPPAGQSRFYYADSALAEIGDVNGDGQTDVAIGSPSADPLGRRDAGVVHVLFGGSGPGRIDVRSSALGGFRIIGPRPGARRPVPALEPDEAKGAKAGSSLAAAGDVNGDGLADILVGAPFAGNRGRAFSGSAYVVFGRRSGEPVDLARLGSAGYRIDGPHAGAIAGHAVAGPGDVNGDGRPDLVLNSWAANTVHVVFGQAGTASVDLRRLAGRGFAIRGGRRVFDAGQALAGAGDFNGDGLADIAIGAPQSDARRREGAGLAFVVFGARDAPSVKLGELDGRGVRIEGEHQFASLGETLAPVGDLNGDGRQELLIGASQVSARRREYAGAAYLVFGSAGPGRLDLRQPGAGAYRILGPGRKGAAGGLGQARAGVSVAGTGDVNGDGLPDMIIGAPGAGRRCAPEEGAAYVVFGQPAPSPLDLGDLGQAGYAIRGGRPDANAGVLVAGAGDWNNDGRADVLVLSGDFDQSRRTQRPTLDLLFGRLPPPLPAKPARAQLPRIQIPKPSLRRLVSGRAIKARLTVTESGPADAVLVEVFAAALGDDIPVALGYATFSQPGTRTVKLVAPRIVRRFLRRRTRLRARTIVSQCTSAGYEHVARGRLVLRRR